MMAATSRQHATSLAMQARKNSQQCEKITLHTLRYPHVFWFDSAPLM
jgi:hypothetical protein